MMTKSYAAAAVFPLLGYALPEAFEIDVEPEWPTGALDSLRSGEFYAESRGEPRPLALPHGASPLLAQPPSEPASYSPFSLPAWLEPAGTPMPPARVPLDPFLAMPPPAPPILTPRPPPAAMPAPPLPPAPTAEPSGLFTLPSWLDPVPPPLPAPHTPRTDPPVVPTASAVPIAGAGTAPPFSPFSPFEDSERTIRHPPQTIGPAPGGFPSWLEPLPPAAMPPASENLSFPSSVATPPTEPSHGGWLERAMISPAPARFPEPPVSEAPVFEAPVSEPRLPEPFPHEPIQTVSPTPEAAGGHPAWRDPSFDPPAATVPVSPAYPAPPSPAPGSEEPPMFRAPPPAAPRPDPGRPARRPLADMFRTLGARPGGDVGKMSQDQ